MKYLVDMIPLLVSDNQMFKKKSFEHSFTWGLKNVLGVFCAIFDFFVVNPYENMETQNRFSCSTNKQLEQKIIM
jgi:hypothetical protein